MPWSPPLARRRPELLRRQRGPSGCIRLEQRRAGVTRIVVGAGPCCPPLAGDPRRQRPGPGPTRKPDRRWNRCGCPVETAAAAALFAPPIHRAFRHLPVPAGHPPGPITARRSHGISTPGLCVGIQLKTASEAPFVIGPPPIWPRRRSRRMPPAIFYTGAWAARYRRFGHVDRTGPGGDRRPTYLFGSLNDAIEIVIHPRDHPPMVELAIPRCSPSSAGPDMKLPCSICLSWPERCPTLRGPPRSQTARGPAQASRQPDQSKYPAMPWPTPAGRSGRGHAGGVMRPTKQAVRPVPRRARSTSSISRA